MSKVFILSGKPILEKKEEESLAKDNIQATSNPGYHGVHRDFL